MSHEGAAATALTYSWQLVEGAAVRASGGLSSLGPAIQWEEAVLTAGQKGSVVSWSSLTFRIVDSSLAGGVIATDTAAYLHEVEVQYFEPGAAQPGRRGQTSLTGAG